MQETFALKSSQPNDIDLWLKCMLEVIETKKMMLAKKEPATKSGWIEIGVGKKGGAGKRRFLVLRDNAFEWFAQEMVCFFIGYMLVLILFRMKCQYRPSN